MNYGMIRFMIGRFLTAAGLTMIFPFFISLYYRETPTTLISFVIPMVSMISLGLLMSTIRVKQTAYFAHEGLVIVGLAWVLVSLFGALPYVLLPSGFSFADAFFESCSSFSTTGATVFTDISGFPRSLLFWRSLSLFFGRIGNSRRRYPRHPDLGIFRRVYHARRAAGEKTFRTKPNLDYDLLRDLPGSDAKLFYRADDKRRPAFRRAADRAEYRRNGRIRYRP